MLPRIEYSVVVPVTAELAFRAFCDHDRLLNREIYEQVAWIEGNPWRIGSRLRYVVTKPLAATVSAVLTGCDPPRFVAILNHALGVTAEQQVSFVETARSTTRVRSMIEFVGKAHDVPDEVIHQAIEFLNRDALDTMATLCQKWMTASSQG